METVLVCVTGQRMCERLIHRGAQVAQEHHMPLLVLSVAGNGLNDLSNPAVAEALDYLYEASASNGAEMTVLCSDKPLDTMVAFATAHGARHLVLGEGKPDGHGNSFAARLALALPLVAFHGEPSV